jgi:hypothetical protein
MHHQTVWDDINTGVHDAISQGLDHLDEGDLINRSDAALSNLPVVGGQQPTTALLLRRYQTQLQSELCVGGRPRSSFDDVVDEVRELTRAVVVTLDTSEGISIENAVLMALILRRRGLASFCAQPTFTPGV